MKANVSLSVRLVRKAKAFKGLPDAWERADVKTLSLIYRMYTSDAQIQTNLTQTSLLNTRVI
jgi:hypothetical protein